MSLRVESSKGLKILSLAKKVELELSLKEKPSVVGFYMEPSTWTFVVKSKTRASQDRLSVYGVEVKSRSSPNESATES